MKNLSQKYDAFYRGDRQRTSLGEVRLNGWPRNRYEAIVHAGGQGGAILDIGCGEGFLLFQFRERFRRLVGLEFSDGRLQQASVNLSEFDFTPVLGSAESMTAIESESIDQIVSADTIEHVPDVYAAASEMHRVLKPGGRLVINTPNIAFLKKRLLLAFGRFPSTSQPNEGLGSDVLFDGGHLHYFTYRSLGLLLERAGFEIVRRTGYGKLGRVHDAYAPLLSGGVQIEARRR